MDLWLVSGLHCMLLNSVHLSGLPISSLSLEFHVENNPKYFTLCFCQDGDCLQAALQRHQSASVWIQGKRVYCSASNTSHLREAAVSSPILNLRPHYRNEARLYYPEAGFLHLCNLTLWVGWIFVVWGCPLCCTIPGLFSPDANSILPPNSLLTPSISCDNKTCPLGGDCPCGGPLSKEYEHSWFAAKLGLKPKLLFLYPSCTHLT